MQPFQSLPVFLAKLKNLHDFLSSSLDAQFLLRLEIVLNQRPADVGAVFEVVEGICVHGHEAFEELLVAVFLV